MTPTPDGASRLAIHGGTPAVPRALPPYRSVGEEERAAVDEVLRRGTLSTYIGAWGEGFYGGPAVRAFENAWAAHFRCKHALSVNSATSGLIAAVGAARIGPGDEVIVPPFTMSATAMAPLFYGGIPVFVDVEDATFCLDPALVEAAITPRTKAIMAVNLFGHPARLGELRRIADANGLVLIEDNAQSPFAAENGRFAGTVGHIGVFSLNYHKHIHTGEGGVCVTDDDDLALRLAMIRNHGENAVEPTGTTDLANLVGFNFRLTEISAALGSVQLRHGEEHVQRRERVAAALSSAVAGLPGLTAPAVRAGCRHVSYVWVMKFDAATVGVSRNAFSRALAAEGFPNVEGYVKPLYLLPLFRERIAIGGSGYPFTLSDRTYGPGLCPVAERLHDRELLWFPTCNYALGDEQIAQLVAAIRKVYAHRATLSHAVPAA
jgi:dTDP-4-amino-4,6-dideoxygalactose transaminase